MIFDELNKTDKMSLPVAMRTSLEVIGTKVLPSNLKYELEVDEDYLDINKPDMIHYIIRGNVITMLSRRKLNEDGLGKYLIYHPNRKYTLKFLHILNQTV